MDTKCGIAIGSTGSITYLLVLVLLSSTQYVT